MNKSIFFQMATTSLFVTSACTAADSALSQTKSPLITDSVQSKSEKKETTESAQRPNIILFLVDDMGWQDTSVPFYYPDAKNPQETFLNRRYRTPNMKRLAQQGMTFTHAYAHPVCSPSRTSLMTGMNPARHRVTNWTLNCDTSTDAKHPEVLPPLNWNLNGLQPVGTTAQGKTQKPITGEEISYRMNKPFLTATTFPEILQQNGYTTIHCGKAHWGTQSTPGSNPCNLGFKYNIAGTEIGGPGDYRGSKKYGNKHRFSIQGLNENNYYENDVFLTEALTQEAILRLNKVLNDPVEKNQPFYLYMSHYAIHAPFDQRGYDKRFAEQYQNPQDGEKWNDNEKRYAALIEGMDKSLGDLMDFLEQKKIDKNTIILFMADNGGLAISGRLGNQKANFPLSFGKGSCREGGIREPMIVSWSGVTSPKSVCHQPVIIEDFFPTILNMAQVNNYKTQQVIDGKSFVPLLKNPKTSISRELLFHNPNLWGEGVGNSSYYHPATALIQDDWKLIYYHITQKMELFNLSKDISEKNNLCLKEPQKLNEMIQKMNKIMTEREAQMPTYKNKNSVNAQEGTTVPYPTIKNN